MKSDYNLPPNVTVRDVSGPEMVECPTCEGVGLVAEDGPCGVPHTNKCPTCSGTGEVLKEKGNQ